MGNAGNAWNRLETQFRSEIRSQYLELSALPFIIGWWVRFTCSEIECLKKWETGPEMIGQYFIILQFEGNNYFKRWGRLKKWN